MAKMLTYIPMPVLFGIFMYMGTSPLQDMQFYQRLLLFITPVKYQPDFPYLRYVRLWRVHIFTLVQLLCMICMWIVKLTKAISIGFPFMLVVMIVVRKLLEYFFTFEELKELDDIMPGSHRKQQPDPEYGKLLRDNLPIIPEEMSETSHHIRRKSSTTNSSEHCHFIINRRGSQISAIM